MRDAVNASIRMAWRMRRLTAPMRIARPLKKLEISILVPKKGAKTVDKNGKSFWDIQTEPLNYCLDAIET